VAEGPSSENVMPQPAGPSSTAPHHPITCPHRTESPPTSGVIQNHDPLKSKKRNDAT
jgi:hypothetical protein